MSAARGRWLELRARSDAPEELQPLLAEGLVALGGRAVQEADGWLVTHVEEPPGPETFLARARALLGDMVGGAGVEVEAGWVEHEEWAETWKRGLEPRRITDRMIVTPSWIPVEASAGQLVVVVDPGMAFGNAEHGTTRGCLRLLDGVVRSGDRILDVGAGSGILAVAAALLGADQVLALEGDPLAADALAENVARNGVADRVRWDIRWVDPHYLAASLPWDGVVANIESGILRPLLSGFALSVRPGGWLVLSGILAEEWPGMRSAAEAEGFRFDAVDEDGEWRSGRFLR